MHSASSAATTYQVRGLPFAFHPSLDRPDHYEDSNWIILPRRVLQESAHAVNIPRFFAVTVPGTSEVVATLTVLEYSAQDGLAYLPQHVLARVPDNIQVQATWPHSGAFARLTHEQSPSMSLDDYLALLTSAFQQRYQVVTLYDEVVVAGLRFTVTELRPDSVTAMADTDVEVELDFCPPKAAASVLSTAQPQPPDQDAETRRDEGVVPVPVVAAEAAEAAATGHVVGTSEEASEAGPNALLRDLHQARLRRQQRQTQSTKEG